MQWVRVGVNDQPLSCLPILFPPTALSCPTKLPVASPGLVPGQGRDKEKRKVLPRLVLLSSGFGALCVWLIFALMDHFCGFAKIPPTTLFCPGQYFLQLASYDSFLALKSTPHRLPAGVISLLWQGLWAESCSRLRSWLPLWEFMAGPRDLYSFASGSASGFLSISSTIGGSFSHNVLPLDFSKTWCYLRRLCSRPSNRHVQNSLPHSLLPPPGKRLSKKGPLVFLDLLSALLILPRRGSWACGCYFRYSLLVHTALLIWPPLLLTSRNVLLIILLGTQFKTLLHISYLSSWKFKPWNQPPHSRVLLNQPGLNGLFCVCSALFSRPEQRPDFQAQHVIPLLGQCSPPNNSRVLLL